MCLGRIREYLRYDGCLGRGVPLGRIAVTLHVVTSGATLQGPRLLEFAASSRVKVEPVDAAQEEIHAGKWTDRKEATGRAQARSRTRRRPRLRPAPDEVLNDRPG